MKELEFPILRSRTRIRKHSPCAFTLLLILIIFILTGALYYTILEYSSDWGACPQHQNTTYLREHSDAEENKPLTAK